jgi:hypothetical protein
MMEVVKFPSPSHSDIEATRAINLARSMASECIEKLTEFLRDETVSDGLRIEAARTLLYYGLEWELPTDG